MAYACNMMAAHWVFTATPLLAQDFSLSHRIYSNSLKYHRLVHSLPWCQSYLPKTQLWTFYSPTQELQWRPLPTTSKNALSSFQEFASPIKVLTPQELAQMPPGCRSLKLSLVVFNHTYVWNFHQSALSCKSLGSCASHLHPRLQDPVGQVLHPSSPRSSPRQGSEQAIRNFCFILWKGLHGTEAYHCLLDLCPVQAQGPTTCRQ